jgi:hypothetical protein
MSLTKSLTDSPKAIGFLSFSSGAGWRRACAKPTLPWSDNRRLLHNNRAHEDRFAFFHGHGYCWIGGLQSQGKIREKQSRRRPLASGKQRQSRFQRRGSLGGAGIRLGDIRFEQAGSTVSGTMGNYSARGVVRGSRVFLALSSGGYVHYTVTLKLTAGTLSGFYSPSVPFNAADQAAVTLRRLGSRPRGQFARETVTSKTA